MSDKADNKKAYRAAGVNGSNDAAKMAASLAELMNTFHEEGYGVQVLSGHGGGLIVIGRLERRPEQEQSRGNPFYRLFELLTAASEDEIPERIKSLLSQVGERIQNHELPDIQKDMPKILPQLLRHLPAHVLQEVAEECETWVARHDKAHADEPAKDDCAVSTVLRMLAKEIRGIAQQQFQ